MTTSVHHLAGHRERGRKHNVRADDHGQRCRSAGPNLDVFDALAATTPHFSVLTPRPAISSSSRHPTLSPLTIWAEIMGTRFSWKSMTGSSSSSQVLSVTVDNVNESGATAIVDNNAAAESVNENASVGTAVGSPPSPTMPMAAIRSPIRWTTTTVVVYDRLRNRHRYRGRVPSIAKRTAPAARSPSGPPAPTAASRRVRLRSPLMTSTNSMSRPSAIRTRHSMPSMRTPPTAPWSA